MDNGWVVGVFTLAGGFLAQLGSRLDANRERQFKKEEAELERQAKRWDARKDLYARFIGTFREAVATAEPLQQRIKLSAITADIELFGSREVVDLAMEINLKVGLLGADRSQERIADLSMAGQRFREAARKDLLS